LPPYEILGELHRAVQKGSEDTFVEVAGTS